MEKFHGMSTQRATRSISVIHHLASIRLLSLQSSEEDGQLPEFDRHSSTLPAAPQTPAKAALSWYRAPVA